MKTPHIREKIVVYGLTQHDAFVSDVSWSPEEHDWVIELDWGRHGKSKVKMRDEGKVWYRHAEMN